MSKPPIPPKVLVHPCKLCGSPAPWLGDCDFSKWCSYDWRLTPTVGMRVNYHRCLTCGLVFSPSFDGFSQHDWKSYVYNEGYLAIDPDYAGQRGESYAMNVAKLFPAAASKAVIDYGCGKGTFGATLSKMHWQHVTNYDPFVPEFSQRPASSADFVFACEVLEHAHDPRGTFEEIASLRAESGVIMATTLLAPANADASILDWWYVAPRNGHVTIHSQKSLAYLAARANLKFASVRDGNLHFFWRQRPDWAATVLPA